MAELQPAEGWKLHLAVDEADQDTVEAGLQGMGIGLDVESKEGPMYKRGRASGQVDKDFTVYVGHKDDADLVASMINESMGDFIKAPSTTESGSGLHDVPMAGNVMGRFSADRNSGVQIKSNPSGLPGMDTIGPKYDQWGSGGVMYMADVRDKQLRGEPIDVAAEEERSRQELAADFGEAFTGTQKEAPAGGGGGGGGGDAPSMDIASGDDGGSGEGFNPRMIFDLVDEAVAEAAEELKSMAQIEAPFLSGDLKESHKVERYAPSSYAVVATVSYAEDVHEGHKVTNKEGGKVYGNVDGNPWFTRAINNLAE